MSLFIQAEDSVRKVTSMIETELHEFSHRLFYKYKAKLRSVMDKVSFLTLPDQRELVHNIVLNVASLELAKNECMKLAACGGSCGLITLRGNAVPQIDYLVFEKTLMEFVRVTVQIQLPNKITYFCSIESQNTSDPKRHGEEVELREAYKEPLFKVAHLFYQYFPFIPHKDQEKV